jgi:branched-chain amino acid transport system ATP-binding protein
VLRAEHISVAYGAHRALEDVSVHVDEGEICVILGANGAGKTTLLKAIAGLLHPAPGAAVSLGDDVLSGETANRIVEAGVALVPEGRGIFGDLTVAENLELGAYGKQARGVRHERLAEVLRLFPKLAERRRQVVRTMSGGEQQMVAVGRALMSNPKILMLDEPSLGLSPLLCSELFETLRDVRETGVGILLVEQNARQSLAIADRAYLMENGRITGEGRAAALLTDPAVQKAFLGGIAQIHRAFGEETTAPPLAAPAPATAAGMAERASQIARQHVAAERHRLINGHASELFVQRYHASSEAIVVTDQAHDLSRKAAEMAARAAEISAAHLAQLRETASLALEAPGRKRKKSQKAKKSKKSKK